MSDPNNTTTCDVETEPFSLSTNALLLNGSLTFENDINDVENFDAYVVMNDETNDRLVDVKLFAPKYYIKTAYDLNSLVTHNPGNDTGNNGIDGSEDDAWELAGVTINDQNAGDTEFNLPTFSLENVPVTTISVNDDSGSKGSFELKMDIEHKSNGQIEASMTWSGSDITGLIDEDVFVAQNAYWHVAGNDRDVVGTAATVPNKDDVDTLSATLTKTNVQDRYSSSTATELAKFNDQNSIKSWTITLDAIGNDTDSNLSKWARNTLADDANDQVKQAPFAEDDQVVCKTGQDFDLNFLDGEGNTRTLVGASTHPQDGVNPNGRKVYGIIYQQTA